jgi:hypothetical protein
VKMMSQPKWRRYWRWCVKKTARTTIEDLIRHEGREPGGGWPKMKFEFTFNLAVMDPAAVERIKTLTMMDIARGRTK